MKYLTMISIFVLVSCGNEEDPIATDEALNSCRSNLLTSVEEIRSNMIGEWELVSWGCGFCAVDPEREAPVADIEFNMDKGSISYEFQGIIEEFEFSWSIVEKEVLDFNNSSFELKTEPAHQGLMMTEFCTDYMISDDRPVDGALHLYRKK